MKLHFKNDEYLIPPGTLKTSLSHPHYKNARSIELSVFNEHRYAFFFWNKWTQQLIESDRINYPPSLVTLDWHQDLVSPTSTEKEWLSKLNLNSNKDVALYSWANLGTLNDTHIMAAAYLNLIGDVYVHCRQGSFEDHWKDRSIKDKYGREHVIKKFKKFKDLEEALLKSDEANVYFDIDLDFFTIDNPLQMGSRSEEYSYVSKKKIKEMLSPDSTLMKWVFQRIQGITIALEPEHTGGLLKSNQLFSLIDSIWFQPSLFTKYPGNWDKQTKWKHLR